MDEHKKAEVNENDTIQEIEAKASELESSMNFPLYSSESEDEETKTNIENKATTSSKKGTQTRRYVAKSKLSRHLVGLMGEANVRFARGETEIAKKMCFEVIRQSPEAYEPYLTLAQIYENINVRKCKAFLLLASHLQPQIESIWFRLAECELIENNIRSAIKYFSKALCADPQNMTVHLRKLQLLESIGDEAAILSCKKRMVRYMPIEDHEQMIKICMEVAETYFKNKQYYRAIAALEIPIKRVPDKVSKHLLNMILELLLISERYSECLDIFTRFCGFAFDITLDATNMFSINSFTMSENLEIDLKVKFIVCVIRLRSVDLIWPLVEPMLNEEEVETYGDLYLDMVEALMAVDEHETALKLTVPLIKSNNFSLAGVWLKHAECLNQCNMYEQAIDAYYMVMSLAPKHVGVLYPLAILLLKMNKRDEALKVLTQDLNSNKIDVALLIEQMKLLREIGDLENYWKHCELLLSRHCMSIQSYEEMRMCMYRDSYKEKLAKIRKLRLVRNHYDDDDLESNLECINEPTPEEEYKFYRSILQCAFDMKEYSLLHKFAFMGLFSKRFYKFFDEIYLTAFYSCVLVQDILNSYATSKELIVRFSRSNLAWNWLAVGVSYLEEPRHGRMLYRNENFPDAPKELILASYHNASGSYVPSFNYFVKEFKRTGSLFHCFMIGVIMSQILCQRLTNKQLKKMMIETSIYLILTYAKKRSKHARQEVYYNVGRMYHQFGITHMAEHFYRKVLKYEDNEMLLKYPNILCLRMEAAFNLHVIYRCAGNTRAATDVLMKHIIVI